MNLDLSSWCGCIYTIGSVAAVLVVIVVGFLAIRRMKRNKRRAAYPKNVVILHQFGRGLNAPSMSPFALKLETWLRVTKIPYKNERGIELSPKKSQIPWITYNNEDVCDSQFCIEYLSNKFDIDLNKNFSNEQKSIARAFFKMTEESLKWQIALRRFVFHPDPSESSIPWIVLILYKRSVKKAAYLQGYGRHSFEELTKIGKDDLKSINNFIGSKKFLMGDEICNEDCALFGSMCQFIFHDHGPLNKFIKDECPNIIRYVNTIKEIHWPDWDDNVKSKRKRKRN